MFNKEVICKAHHEVMLQPLLVHHDGTACVMKCHPWKILKLAHRCPLYFPLSQVVVHLTRGDRNACEIMNIIAHTLQMVLFEAIV
jgi:hypothetical protein